MANIQNILQLNIILLFSIIAWYLQWTQIKYVILILVQYSDLKFQQIYN